ncbi:MAG: pantetheine-phosphate adenylyltransferase, partial [Lentisphaeria bacterium]|nr:pantetheine-phosphate adenylyltransferase [Lentisphaeria bacterium]
GHLDVIKRAAKIFDTLVVMVANNQSKNSLFTIDERVTLLEESCACIANVKVSHFKGLLHDEVRHQNAVAVIRGLRAVSDFEWELQMALMNRELDQDCETLFLMPSPKFSFVSSTMIKEIAKLDGDVSPFVPPIVENELKRRLGKNCDS